MAEYDAEVSRAIWNGKIPIQFTFAATEQVTPAEMSSIPVFVRERERVGAVLSWRAHYADSNGSH